MITYSKTELIDAENSVREAFKSKKIRSMFHLSGGCEEQLIDIFKDVNPEDWVFSTHRSHYHALLKGMSSEELVDRVINGESMHMFSKELKLFTSAIVGGVLPISIGVALGIKEKNTNEHVWVFVGDMCATMGVFHECVMYAKGHDLPITFVVEDNGLCINADTSEVWGVKPTTLDEWNNGIVKRYSYSRTFPHAGSGDWVDFSKP